MHNFKLCKDHLNQLIFMEYTTADGILISSEVICPVCNRNKRATGEDLDYFKDHPNQVQRKIISYQKRPTK